MNSVQLHAPAIRQRLSAPQMRQAVCRAVTDVRQFPFTNVAVADQFARSISWPLASISGKSVAFEKEAFCRDVFEGKVDPDNLGKGASGEVEVQLFSDQIGEIRSVNTAFSVVGAVIREVLTGQDQRFVGDVSGILTFPVLSRFIKETNSWLKQMGEDVYPDEGTHANPIDAILQAASLAFEGLGS